jgi:hypothetical protein
MPRIVKMTKTIPNLKKTVICDDDDDDGVILVIFMLEVLLF